MLAAVVKKKMKTAKMLKPRQSMWSLNIEKKGKLQWLHNPVILGMVPENITRKRLVVLEPSYMMEHIVRRVSLDVL